MLTNWPILIVGEKFNEQMIGPKGAPHTHVCAEHCKVLAAIHNWSRGPARVGDGNMISPHFTYRSDNNTDLMSIASLRA